MTGRMPRQRRSADEATPGERASQGDPQRSVRYRTDHHSTGPYHAHFHASVVEGKSTMARQRQWAGVWSDRDVSAADRFERDLFGTTRRVWRSAPRTAVQRPWDGRESDEAAAEPSAPPPAAEPVAAAASSAAAAAAAGAAAVGAAAVEGQCAHKPIH